MKTKSAEEIQEMISKCQQLRKGIPHFSFFGDDNWENIDKQIEALNDCLSKDEDEIKGNLSTILNAYEDEDGESTGDDWMENPTVQVYDWVLGNTEDDLVTDDDLEVFDGEKE